MKKYMICEAPLCVGAPTRGSECAFEHLVKNGLVDHLGKSDELCPFEEERVVENETERCDLRCLETVMQVNRHHYKNLMRAFEKGFVPVTVGGDHSIAISSISAASDTYGAENTTVIYVDGHADINTEKTSESGYIHGMSLAAVMGLCSKELDIGEHKTRLFGKNTYIVGARSIDDGEYPIIEKEGVTLYTAEDLKREGADKVLSEIIDKVKGKRVHLSFDVDFIDCKDFPATGYVMPNGASFETAIGILKRIIDEVRPVSMDLVEYNPTLDGDGACLGKMMKIFSLLKGE